MKPVPLNFPLGGESDNVAFGAQPNGTTQEGKDVRGIDPKTGRARGAQRSGMTRHVAGHASAEGTKVQALTSLGYAADLVTHANVTNLDFDAGTEDGSIEWQTTSKTKLDALDCDVDRQGNVYLLVDGGLIEKYNSAGTRVADITIPAASSEVLVRRIEVSDLNIVFAVTRNDATGTGSAYAFQEVERTGQKFFDVLWQLDLGLVPYDFSVRGSLMYVLSEVEEDDNAPVYSVVQLISGINQAAAIPAIQFAVPSRPASLAIGPQGAVFVTCPSQPQRTATPAGFTARTESWSPHEISNSPQTRIYGWWDAASLLDAVDGKKIKELPYRRTFADEQGATVTEILDETKRPLVNIDGLGRQKNRSAPRYDATAFGAMPGIRFNQAAAAPELFTITEAVDPLDPSQGTRTSAPADYAVTTPLVVDDLITGQGLVSRPNRDPAPKAVNTDPLPRSRAIFPGYDSPVFMIGMVLRVTRGSGPSIVMQHKGDDFNFGILANVAEGQDFTAAQAETDGSLTFVYGDGSVTPATTSAQEDAPYSTIRWNSSADNPTDTVVVVLIQDSGSTYLRVNGELYHEWGTPGTQAGTGAKTFTSIGGTVKAYPSTLDLFQNANLQSFDGAVAEVITVLGQSSGGVHNVNFGHPSGENTVDDGAGASQTSFGYYVSGSIQEWEELEGYLAHRWGVSHLLPNGLGGSYNYSGTTYQNDHPYGGTSNAITGTAGVELDANLIALRNPGPILAKYGPNYGDLKWALAENGVGHGVTVDSEGNVLTIGEYIEDGGPYTDYQQPIQIGSTSQNIVARKILDLGNSYSLNVRSEGVLTFTGNPADGETFAIELEGVTTTFEFESSGGVAAGNISVTIGGSTATTVNNALVAIKTEYESQGLWPNGIIANADTTANTVTIRANLARFTDGSAFSLTESSTSLTATDFTGGTRVPGSWEYWDSLAAAPQNSDARILTDVDDDLYYPLSSTGRACQMRKLVGTSTTGVTESRWDLCMEPVQTSPTYRYAANGIALSPNAPDWNPATVTGPEYVYVATDTGRLPADTLDMLQGTNVLHKLRVVNVTRDAQQLSPRRSVGIVVSGGDLKTFTPEGGYEAPTGGVGAFASQTNHFSHTTLNGLAFFSDSIDTKVYDPKNDAVRSYTATDDGEVPPRILYMSSWRGRMVVVSADDQFNWSMSARRDAFGWNEYLEVPTSEQAISGNNPASLGKNPDVITAIIPYNDDVLWFGGDHTIHRMIGDPMAVALGGDGQRVFGLVTDKTGIAPGSAWTKDPEGMLYFFGTTGGVYATPPNGAPRRISLNRIERALQDVDLNAYRVDLVWNVRDEGLHVFQFPVGAGGTAVSSYFWERKTDSWWEDTFAPGTTQPTAAFVLDGDDPEDRRLLLGGEDGAIRRWDGDSVSDDGERIASSVLIGPYSAEEEVRFSHLKVTLASNQHGARAEVFTSSSPDVRGEARFAVDLKPGQNPFVLEKARGSYYWVRLYNAAIGERWAYESGSVMETRVSRKQVR